MRRGPLIGIVIAGVALAGIPIGIALSSIDQTPSAAIDAGQGATYAPRAPLDAGWTVERVVDGDTMIVVRGDERDRVRLVGIDTPESVKPNSPVECFGPEAADFADLVLTGRSVWLEPDPLQPPRDKYDRRLAYLWFQPTRTSTELAMFNLLAVEDGYAREATYGDGYHWRSEFLAAQSGAQQQGLGLWGACS